MDQAYFVKPIEKILFQGLDKFIQSEQYTYTNRLSHVHIRPHDSPVMLTSPKRRCQDQFEKHILSEKNPTFNTCCFPAFANSYLSRSNSCLPFDSRMEALPLARRASSSNVCSSIRFSMVGPSLDSSPRGKSVLQDDGEGGLM